MLLVGEVSSWIHARWHEDANVLTEALLICFFLLIVHWAVNCHWMGRTWREDTFRFCCEMKASTFTQRLHFSINLRYLASYRLLYKLRLLYAKHQDEMISVIMFVFFMQKASQCSSIAHVKMCCFSFYWNWKCVIKKYIIYKFWLLVVQ